MTPKQIGILGEKITITYFKKKGYQILDKNYSPHFISGPKRGEIDIIAKNKDSISFIEVKTLTQDHREVFSVIGGEEKVNFKKRKKIIKMAETWLRENRIPLNSKWQIDVISVIIDLSNKKAKIRHFKNVACE